MKAARGRPLRPIGTAAAVVCLAACTFIGACRARDPLPLAPGVVHVRNLPADGPYRLRFSAPAGVFLHLDVEQRGVDVVVLLRDSAGRLLFEIDTPNGAKGTETVLVVTPSEGIHELIVEPFAPGAQGAFAFQVREVRPATKRDRVRAAAAAAFARAERYRLARDVERAAEGYVEALPHLAALGDQRRLAEAEWHLGEAFVTTGRLRRAAAHLEQSAARFRKLGDDLGEARALNDLGAAWRLIGELRRALAAYRRCLGLYRKGGNAAGEATAQANVGLALEAMGDHQGAIEQYEVALAQWRRLGVASEEAKVLQNLGSLHTLIGHDAAALDFHQKALALLSGEVDPERRASALIALGWSQYLSGHAGPALERFRAAIALAERLNRPLLLAGALDRCGSALRALGRHREAAAAYARALGQCRAAGSRTCEGNSLANLGWLDLAMDDPGRARPRLRRSLQLLAISGDANGEAYARVGLSQAERRLGNLQAAREQAEAAVRRVEQLRLGLRGPASRGQFLATRFDAYEEWVTLLLELDRREPGKGHALRGLEVAERARARLLVEQIADRSQEAVPHAAVLRAEIRTTEQRREMLAAEDPRDPRLPALDVVLRARWLELDRLDSQLSRRESAAASLGAREIQALADEGSLLVAYLLAEPASFAWTIDREEVVVHVLPGRESIERLARRTVAALVHGNEHAGRVAGDRVLEELAGAVLQLLAGRLAGHRRVVILADGALHLIPFAALPLRRPESPGEAEPLLVTHEVVMLPSATALAVQRRRLAKRPPAPRAVAVLADPIFNRDDGRLSAGAERRGAAWLDPRRFERLPYTADEARAIVSLVPPGEALLALGPAANRDLVVGGDLRRFRILHFATHGLLHPVLPERSGIVLSQLDSQGQPRDGFLSAPDVAPLDLPAELVVLSACETGLGRELRGEGLVGLTQSFFRAGARRVVVSHWTVRDRATAELMARFYRYLFGERLPPAAALRAAQLSLRAEEPWRRPFFWAGFSLHGDWR